MYYMLSFLMLMMFFSGVVSFSLKRKHMLLMLLSLEVVVLSLYMGLFMLFNLYIIDYFCSMIFLSVAVCEGSLGLSVLVMMIRSFGNDFVMSGSFLW